MPILHLIVTPFPSVWHKAGDNANAIDWDDTEDLNKILRVFVAEYLQVCWIWDQILMGLHGSAKSWVKDCVIAAGKARQRW